MFRKNPVMVEAVQVTPHGFKGALAFAGEGAEPVFKDGEPAIKIPAVYPDGSGSETFTVSCGEWLVKEPIGVVPISDADFEKEYHPVRGPKTVKDKVAGVDDEIPINAMDMMSMPEKEPATRGRKK